MELAVDVGGEVGHEHQELAQLVAAESPGAGVDYAVLGEQGRETLRVQGSALAQAMRRTKASASVVIVISILRGISL